MAAEHRKLSGAPGGHAWCQGCGAYCCIEGPDGSLAGYCLCCTAIVAAEAAREAAERAAEAADAASQLAEQAQQA